MNEDRAWVWTEEVIHKLEAYDELLATLVKIRDLARTGSAPIAMGIPSDMWESYKINEIAYISNKALAKVMEMKG